jgi:hypothetical protein
MQGPHLADTETGSGDRLRGAGPGSGVSQAKLNHRFALTALRQSVLGSTFTGSAGIDYFSQAGPGRRESWTGHGFARNLWLEATGRRQPRPGTRGIAVSQPYKSSSRTCPDNIAGVPTLINLKKSLLWLVARQKGRDCVTA